MGSEPVSTDSCRKASPDSATDEAYNRPQRTVLMYAQTDLQSTKPKFRVTTSSPPVPCFLLPAPLGPWHNLFKPGSVLAKMFHLRLLPEKSFNCIRSYDTVPIGWLQLMVFLLASWGLGLLACFTKPLKKVFTFFINFAVVVLGIESKTLHILGKHSTTLQPKAHTLSFINF